MTSPPPLPPPRTTHWEYKVYLLKFWEPEIAEEELNRLGAEGWEMIGMSLTWRGHGRAVFKRIRPK